MQPAPNSSSDPSLAGDGTNSAPGRPVEFASGTETLRGWLALPAGQEPVPGLVIIHEAWGLDQGMREITERFAHAGYCALAVDLFSSRFRPVCMARFMAGQLFSPLENQGIRDLRSALTWLSAQPRVDAARLGAVGYCMGGQFAIAWACTDPRLRVIAPHYGMLPGPPEALARLCPVVGTFPGKDFTAKSGRRLREILDRSHIENDIKIYLGARHSFCNSGSRAYDPIAAADAWQRTTTFFAKHLHPFDSDRAAG